MAMMIHVPAKVATLQYSWTPSLQGVSDRGKQILGEGMTQTGIRTLVVAEDIRALQLPGAGADRRVLDKCCVARQWYISQECRALSSNATHGAGSGEKHISQNLLWG